MPKPSKNCRKFSVGFTLIELIIVIVVIGILALLVAVNFSGIVMKSKKAGFNVSAQSVLRAMQVKEAGEDGFDPLGLNETNIQSSLNITPNNFDSLAVYLYNNQDYVYIVGKNDYAGLTACGVRGNVSVELSEEASCPLGGSSYTVAKTTDTTAGTFGGGDGSTCTLAMTIDSIEDLVALSNNVNGGNTYLNKCIKLAIDLDFNQSKSYVNPASTAYGDINGNAIIEGLKTELTTGAGFNPIGTSTNSFRGTLIGELHNIYGLYVNRPTTSYVGMFGYVQGGTVTAINLIAANITGFDYTGGFFGYGYDIKMTESNYTGNVTGNNYSGLIGGYIHNNSLIPRITSVAVEGNLTGANNVGGIIGYSNSGSGQSGFISGINKGGNIVSTGANVGRIRGGDYYCCGAVPYLYSSLSINTVTVNGSTVVSNDSNSQHGGDITSLSDLNDINTSELVRDTYIGGDDDGNGYYWDYDNNGDVVLKDIITNPLTFNLSGSGTLVDPYIVNNYTDLRQASQKPKSNYKLTSNIDLSGQKFYMIGSYQNRFTGVFNGDLKTISNISINAPKASYLGFTGFLTGTVTLLNLTNISITGQNNIGGVVGYVSNGHAIQNTVTGNIVGNNNLGLVVGYLYSYLTALKVSSSSVNGNITGVNNVGGLVGYENSNSGSEGVITGLVNGGSFIATGSGVGYVRGKVDYCCGALPSKLGGVVLSSSTINGSSVTSSDSTSSNGITVASMNELNDINVAEVALDTYIGGDDDNNGYYWDYDNDGNIVMKNTSTNPLSFSLSGAGTIGDPYLINNYADLRQAALKLSSNFKLTADIDMTSQKFYPLGSYQLRFTGSFDGNYNTISNLTINSPKVSYLGFSGNSSGTFKNINFNNLNLTGYNYVAGIAAYSSGTIASINSINPTVNGHNFVSVINGINHNSIKGINISGMTLNGNDTVGGVSGFNTYSRTIKDCVVIGNASGNNDVGLGVGENSQGVVASFVVQGDVSGSAYVGGINGYNYDASVKGINMGGSVIGATYGGRNIGRNRYGGVDYSYAISSITVNGATVVSTDVASAHGADIVASDLTSSTIYTNAGFNFTDETLDYIWYIDGAYAKFREGNL